MLVVLHGAALVGVEAHSIRIEVNADRGIAYHLIGLPGSAIKESGYRISAALKNSGFRMPGMKITINLAPASLRKEGSGYDLPMAIGILVASRQIEPFSFEDYLLLGELSLNGGLRPVRGALPIALLAKKLGLKGLIVPKRNAREASVVEGLNVYGAGNLSEVVKFLCSGAGLQAQVFKKPEIEETGVEPDDEPDFDEVKGQESVKRCLEIAAAGGHNVLMVGPPGSGKSMLAKRIPGILPPMTKEEGLEVTKVHSVAGKLTDNHGLLRYRPFRSPHHSTSPAALLGGGVTPTPGEISLAHNGVLFLDELPEFKRGVLEVLRQPLEDRVITISRSRAKATFPSNFMLVASMNPSREGFFTDSNSSLASRFEARRYVSRISRPLLDRIDLQIEVQAVPFEKMSSIERGESSRAIRKRVLRAREVQGSRFRKRKGLHVNAQMEVREIRRFCIIEKEAQGLLEQAMNDLKLSARAYHRILKVARTIADLASEENIQAIHIAEAIQYRGLDRMSI